MRAIFTSLFFAQKSEATSPAAWKANLTRGFLPVRNSCTNIWNGEWKNEHHCCRMIAFDNQLIIATGPPTRIIISSTPLPPGEEGQELTISRADAGQSVWRSKAWDSREWSYQQVPPWIQYQSIMAFQDPCLHVRVLRPTGPWNRQRC